MDETYDYDVAVTFAGEDRDFVARVVRDLTATAGFKVFYDQDEQVTLWGEDLTEYFPKIYESRARFAVMFISRDYAAKPWTRLERRSVLVRALNQATPYLLPVRLDDTRLDGVRDSVSYLDGNLIGPAGVAAAIRAKLGSAPVPDGGRFNGRVPRNRDEMASVVGERPPAWEYLLFSYALVERLEAHANRLRDFRMGFSEPGEYVPDDAIMSLVTREMAIVQHAISNVDAVLSPDVQLLAFGEPGSPGDPDNILHIADRFAEVYRFFLDWASRIRGVSTESDEARTVMRTLSNFATAPVGALASLPYDFRARMDLVPGQIDRDEDVEIDMTVRVNLPAEDLEAYENALGKFRKRMIPGS